VEHFVFCHDQAESRSRTCYGAIGRASTLISCCSQTKKETSVQETCPARRHRLRIKPKSKDVRAGQVQPSSWVSTFHTTKFAEKDNRHAPLRQPTQYRYKYSIRPFLPAPGSTESERSVALAEIRGMRESWLDSRMTEKSAGSMNLGFHQRHGGAFWYKRESWVSKYMMTSLESMWLSNQPKLIL
jgi:hypothetical protein